MTALPVSSSSYQARVIWAINQVRSGQAQARVR